MIPLQSSGPEHAEVSREHFSDDRGGGLGAAAAAVLDLVIAVYALVLVVIFVTGGLDLGVVSLNDAAKPILILLLAIPVRLTLGQRSWMLGYARKHAAPWLSWVTRRRIAVAPEYVDVAVALISILPATFLVAFFTDLLLAPNRRRAFSMPFERERFAYVFAGWDSGWYFDIASRGYYFSAEGQSSIAFFPLYPMLMRVVAWPFGATDRAIWIAGIGISCTAFALALLVLHRFTQRIFGEREIARRAVFYLALFPFALFFTRVYAESLFLLTSILAVSRAHEGRWGRAGLWGALATLARPNGILIGLPLVLMTLADRPAISVTMRRMMYLLPVPAALAGYSGYVYLLSGDPLAWLSAQQHWGYSLGHPPWEQLLKMVGRFVKYGFYDYFFVSRMATFRLFHGVIALAFLALVPAVWKRLGPAMGAYVLVSLLIPLSGNALEGVGRYSAVLFPAFMVVGSFRSRGLYEAILVTSTVFLALFVSLFAAGRPIY